MHRADCTVPINLICTVVLAASLTKRPFKCFISDWLFSIKSVNFVFYLPFLEILIVLVSWLLD